MEGKLLKGKIIAKGYSVEGFCAEVGISKTTFYRKLSGITEFSRSEIEQIIRSLELNENEIIEIFFAKKVS